MPNVNTQFKGQTLVIPGAYYDDNVSAENPTNPSPVPPMTFIGAGYGGEQNVVSQANSSTGLNALIRGGPSASFVPFIFNPSPEMKGASTVNYINPSPNTPSTLQLSASGTAVIELTSTNWGAPSNLLQAEITAGSAGGIDLTIIDGYSLNQVAGSNLGIPFQLVNTSAGAASFTISGTGGVANAFIINGTEPGSSFNFPIGGGTYETITSLVEAINATGFYSALVISDTNGGAPSAGLDLVSDVNLPAYIAGVYVPVNVTSEYNDVVFWVGEYASSLASASLINDAIAVSGVTLNEINITYFSGATNGVPTLQDYANALNYALRIPTWTIALDTNMPGAVALGTQHAITASSISNKSYRRFFSGSSIGDSIATTAGVARSMNTTVASYVYPGIWATNIQSGANQLYGGLYVAAACAAISAGNKVAEPLTNKALTGNGVEVVLDVPEINILQKAGVICVSSPNNSGIPTIVSDLTTWQNDSNPENVFNQQVACRQFLAYSMIGAAQPYIGRIDSGLISIGVVNNAMKLLLNSLLFTAPGSSGILSSWNAKSLQMSYTGATQTLAIIVDVVFVGQNRFITMYVPVQPLNAV